LFGAHFFFKKNEERGAFQISLFYCHVAKKEEFLGEFFFFGVFLETRHAKEEEQEEEEETERDTDERRERNVRAGSARRLSAELFCLFESVGTFLVKKLNF